MRREFSAGGVVVRRLRGAWVFAAIRPAGKKPGLWALPKGNIGPGEKPDATALREVEEETGLRCRLGTEVGKTRYRDSQGRSKVVRYWLMEPEAGEFTPNEEVDEVRWLSAAEAESLLTYDHDRALLREAGA